MQRSLSILLAVSCVSSLPNIALGQAALAIISGGGEQAEFGSDGFDNIGFVDFSTSSVTFGNNGSFSNDNGSTTYFASVGPKQLRAKATARKFSDINFRAGAYAFFTDTLKLRSKNDHSTNLPFKDGFLQIRTSTEGTLENGSVQANLSVFGKAPDGTLGREIGYEQFHELTSDNAIELLDLVIESMRNLHLINATEAFLEWELEVFADTRFGTVSESDFSSTAEILSIDVLLPDGTIDPTVEVVGTSGVVYSSQTQVNAVPEPASIATWSLIGLGLVGFGYIRIRRTK